jgi:hypothetical protein
VSILNTRISKTQTLIKNQTLLIRTRNSSHVIKVSYPLWASASLSRCTITAAEFLYPDLSESDEPLRLFVVSLMVEVAVLLKDTRDNIRYAAVNIVVALLQQKRGIMSGLLIKDIQNGDRMISISNSMIKYSRAQLCFTCLW